MSGLVLTLVIHALIGLVAGAWTVGFPGGGEGEESGRLVEFAVMSEAELAAISDARLESESLDVPEISDSSLPELDLFDDEASAALDALAAEELEIDLGTGAGDLSVDGSELSESSGAGSLGGASFFGLSAQGTRFAYIVDISSSMRDQNKMVTTKRELTSSITALDGNAEYFIVLYSDGANPLGGRRAYRDATDFNKRRTREQIAEIFPAGATKPLGAFQMIFAMRTRPDAIYFMTDGDFDQNVPARVAELNQRYRIPVHTILFGDAGNNAAVRDYVREMMQRIARQSNGTFVHRGVDGAGP